MVDTLRFLCIHLKSQGRKPSMQSRSHVSFRALEVEHHNWVSEWYHITITNMYMALWWLQCKKNGHSGPLRTRALWLLVRRYAAQLGYRLLCRVHFLQLQHGKHSPRILKWCTVPVSSCKDISSNVWLSHWARKCFCSRFFKFSEGASNDSSQSSTSRWKG